MKFIKTVLKCDKMLDFILCPSEKAHTLLEYGNEWIYENIISYGGYKTYKILQCLNSQWYKMLDQPWFRKEDILMRKSLIRRYYRNGLQIYNCNDIISTFDLGYQHGPEKQYYSNGKVLEETMYFNGLKNGTSIIYCYNGNIGSICNYKNGILDGPCKIYYDDGILASEISYKAGKLDGVFNHYNENGINVETIIYRNDIRV